MGSFGLSLAYKCPPLHLLLQRDLKVIFTKSKDYVNYFENMLRPVIFLAFNFTVVRVYEHVPWYACRAQTATLWRQLPFTLAKGSGGWIQVDRHVWQ